MIVSSIFLSLILNIYIIKAKNDCQYSTPDGVLDLRTFGYTGRPKYNNIPDTNPLTTLIYSFNGCFPYSTTSECRNAAACSTDGSQTTRLIARQTVQSFVYTKGLSTITYTNGADTTLHVLITCTTTESIEATKINDQTFLYNIESACGCPGKCTYKSPSSLSGGGVFLIILVLLSFIAEMFVPLVEVSVCYLLMLLIQTITGASPCVYDVGNKQQIDIRTLGVNNPKQPKYDNIPNSSPVPSTFSWNGCFSYSKPNGGNCINAAACLTRKDTGESTLIAKQSDAKFEHHDDVNLLIYHSSPMLLTVYLTCRDDEEDTINGRQDDADTFNIHVQSRCCCPGKCRYSNGSLSGGGIFLIILVVLLFVYVVGGILFLRLRRGASGVDLIPNRLLWLSITSSARDGLRYSMQVIRQRKLEVDYQQL